MGATDKQIHEKYLRGYDILLIVAYLSLWLIPLSSTALGDLLSLEYARLTTAYRYLSR